MRFICIARRSADHAWWAFSAIRLGHVLLVAISTYSCFGFGLGLSAQPPDSETAEEQNKSSWTATTDLKSDDLGPQRIPVRIIESHRQNGNRTEDHRSVEIRGADGYLKPYQEIDREILSVDASTTRTTTRTFGRDANRSKALVQITEEEQRHISPGDESNIVRVTYNPDVNGKLQPIQREFVETKRLGTDMEETNVTVMLPSVNGGLAPAFKTHELRKRAANDTVESETTWLPDVNGKWQLGEIREVTTRQDGTNRTTDERVSRPDSEGKLVEVSRVAKQETESTSGEKRRVVESYSIDVPGVTRDGNLHLIERNTNSERPSPIGERVTEQRVERTIPGESRSNLRVSILVDGRMVPGPSGEQSSVTIRTRDWNGSFGIVSVDTTKTDRIPSI